MPEAQALTDGRCVPELILHGEEDILSLESVVPGETYRVTSKIVNIIDKGKMLLFVALKEISHGSIVCTRIHSKVLLRDVGNTGFNSGVEVQPLAPSVKRPSREADLVSEYKLRADQAALYRLLGDKNPFHIDWAMAKNMGFQQPILHGLCTLAISSRTAYEHAIAKGLIKRLPIHVLSCRFTCHVYPGETLIIQTWLVDPAIMCIETYVKERPSHPVFKCLLLLSPPQ